MPAEVETMMYAGEMPWHGIGKALPERCTPREALVFGGIDWLVDSAPIFAKIGDKYVEIKDRKAIYRTNDDSVLGDVGGRYEPIQNDSFCDLFNVIVDEKLANIETCGSLYAGRKVFMLAKLPSEILIPNAPEEQIKNYLLLVNSHDGSFAWRAFFTNVRVVCANTLNMAMNNTRAMKEGISIRHTATAEARIKEAHRIIALANSYNKVFQAKALVAATQKYTDKMMAELAKKLFVPEGTEESKISTRSKNMQEKVLELFAYGKGHEAIRGTAWAAMNAVAEFADHDRATRTSEGGNEREARLVTAWFGSGKLLKEHAWNIIQEQVPAIAKAA